MSFPTPLLCAPGRCGQSLSPGLGTHRSLARGVLAWVPLQGARAGVLPMLLPHLIEPQGSYVVVPPPPDPGAGVAVQGCSCLCPAVFSSAFKSAN